MSGHGADSTHRSTAPYESFRANFDQAFLLARLIHDAGMVEVRGVLDSTDRVVSRVSGLDVASFVALSDKAKAALDARITRDDEREMAAESSRTEPVAQLATTTVPQVLLIFMVTIFEAYLEDLLRLICSTNPLLLDAAERGLAQASGKNPPQGKALTRDTEKRIRELFAVGWDHIIPGVFGQGFGLAVVELCTAAKTTPQGLDRIKVVRNLYVHRGGIINRKALDRLGDSRYTIGERYPLDYAFLVSAKDQLFFFGLGLDMLATAKYPEISDR